MSHFRRLKTKIREREHLIQALKDLRLEAREGKNLPVRGWSGREETAEIVVATGSPYDVGLRRKGEEYEVVADWWGLERHSALRQKEFMQDLQRRYAYNVVREQAREQNLVIEEERTLENGDVVITLSERG
jgi:hypothetical protein